MGQNFLNVDLVRLSQTALPIAKPYDKDKNGTLDKKEYENFIKAWEKEHPNDSPLLMQLHTQKLSTEAEHLGAECDYEFPKGVLTEDELKKFMELYDKSGLTTPFKKNTTVKGVLTGEDDDKYYVSADKYESPDDNWRNNFKVKKALFTNWLKLDVIGYKGSDKFFHAVGNYEAMMAGPEKTVKKVCAGQDEDKRRNSPRPEADYTEDLYANWLGREFAKMYPNQNAHEVFKALAPKGFDTSKSQKSATTLFYEKTKSQDNWFNRKINQYTNYFKENYIIQRLKKEISDFTSD